MFPSFQNSRAEKEVLANATGIITIVVVVVVDIAIVEIHVPAVVRIVRILSRRPIVV